MREGIKMTNVALFLGTGNIGADVLYKMPWIRHLNKTHTIYVVSTFKPELHLNRYLRQYIGKTKFNDIQKSVCELMNTANIFSVIYDSLFLKKQYSLTDLMNLQDWLGISFQYLSSLSRSFYNKEKMQDTRSQMDLNNFLSGLVEFFRDFFARNKIDVFINTIEDTTISVIAYYVAKKMKILNLGFVFGRFPKRGVMFCKDFTDVCGWNEEDVDWDEIEKLYGLSTITGKDTMLRNINYWCLSSLVNRILGIRNVINYRRYAANIVHNCSYEKLMIPQITLFSASKGYLIGLIRSILITNVSRKPNHTDDYFLFPLHYTEDAQITFREPFLDQFELIRFISRALPYGYYIYVKPHPHYFGTDVSYKELKKLSRLKNVKIIDPSTPPIKLIRSSRGVLTINSTTGFEALIMGIPVVTFGHDFYCKDELCYVVRDINDLSETLLDAANGVKQPDRNAIMKFVKKVYANTIWIKGIYDELGFYGLTDVDGKNIASALNRILEKLEGVK